MGAYAPATGKKHFENVKKNPNEKFELTSQHSMCAHQVSRKTDIFMASVKKTKKLPRKQLFVFLHMPRKMSVFRGTTL
jgi:hypothetical protein